MKKKISELRATIYGVLFSPLEKGLSLAANSGVVFVTASGRLNRVTRSVGVLDYNIPFFFWAAKITFGSVRA